MMLHKSAICSPINSSFLSLVKIWIETLILVTKKAIPGKIVFISAEVYRCRNTSYGIFQLFSVLPRISEALEGYNVQVLLAVHPLEILPPSIFALVTD